MASNCLITTCVIHTLASSTTCFYWPKTQKTHERFQSNKTAIILLMLIYTMHGMLASTCRDCNVLQCDFSEPIFLADIERYYRKPAHPQISQAIASPPLCPYNISDARWDFRLCPKMTSETLGNACKNYYKLTVIKVLMKRIPYNSLEKTLSALRFPRYKL